MRLPSLKWLVQCPLVLLTLFPQPLDDVHSAHHYPFSYFHFASHLSESLVPTEATSRASRPVQSGQNSIIPTTYFIPSKSNICALYLDSNRFKDEHKIIIENFRNHPFRRLICDQPTVPYQYQQQWWQNLVFNERTRHLESKLVGESYEISLERFKDIVRLPRKNDIDGKNDFDSVPTSDMMIRAINRLGYLGRLTTISLFRRKNLPPAWYCLFCVINKCLTVVWWTRSS